MFTEQYHDSPRFVTRTVTSNHSRAVGRVLVSNHSRAVGRVVTSNHSRAFGWTPTPAVRTSGLWRCSRTVTGPITSRWP